METFKGHLFVLMYFGNNFHSQVHLLFRTLDIIKVVT